MARSSVAKKLAPSAPVFAALGDEVRLHLVGRLCDEGPLSISRLAEGAQVTRQAVSKHLQVLADAGLVKDSWEGRERVFSLEAKRLQRAQAHLEVISQRWDQAVGRLRRMVEDE